jgi:ribulose-5-phosphate 4-epimerase/fuculose-1-phosphate aldolase
MITVGADLTEAVITAVMLKRAARYQLLAAAGNPDFSFSSDAAAISKREQHFTRGNTEGASAYRLRRMAKYRPTQWAGT